MLKFYGLLLAVLAAAVVAELEDDPKPCCFPQQLEGFVAEKSMVVAHRQHRREGSLSCFAIDYKAQKLAASGLSRSRMLGADGADGLTKSHHHHHHHRGRLLNYTIIADFAAKKLYMADRHRERCRVAPLKHAMPDSCAMLANATYSHSFSLGAGDGELKLNTWTLGMKRRGVRAGVGMVVQGSNCAPVMEEARGRVRRARFSQEKMFADLRLSIKDPAIFTPPSYCKSDLSEKLMLIGGQESGDVQNLKWQREMSQADSESDSESVDEEDDDLVDPESFSDDLEYIMELFGVQ